MNKRRIGILTAGGDCPGLNAIIRAVAKKAITEQDFEVIGIEDGFEGLIHNHWHRLTFNDVSGIINQGGTILGTSNTADPYNYAIKKDDQIVKTDVSETTLKNIEDMAMDCLVCIGGDGSMSVAERLAGDGVPIVGLPKTIDNDVVGTDITVGFDTAVGTATEAIDRVHTSAQSHHRVMIVEVMGRNAGWLALHSGIAGGGDVILLPEMPYDLDNIVKYVVKRNKTGKKFTIIVISEGSHPVGGEVVIRSVVQRSVEQIRLGGISFNLAQQIEDTTDIETRAVVLGHLLRGGPPTATDRFLATRLGTAAIDHVIARDYGKMVGVQDDKLVPVPFGDIANRQRKIPLDHPMIRAARSVGTCFGDE